MCIRDSGKLIQMDQTHQVPAQLQTGRDQGMQTLDQALMAGVMAKELDPDAAYLNALDRRPFQRYVTDSTILPRLELPGA